MKRPRARLHGAHEAAPPLKQRYGQYIQGLRDGFSAQPSRSESHDYAAGYAHGQGVYQFVRR